MNDNQIPDMAYLLKVLLVGLLVYYIIRFFARGFAALFKVPEDVTSAKTNRRQEGDVRVESTQSPKSHISKDEGEYVDFEEVD